MSDSRVPGYRHFADLISPIKAVGEAARSELPVELASLSSISLVRLVVGIGRKILALDQLPDAATLYGTDRLGPLVADVVALGTDMLGNWPEALRDRVIAKTRTACTIADRSQILDLRKAVAKHFPEHDVLRKALPEVFENGRRALSFGTPVVLASEAARKLRGNVSKFREFERKFELHGVETASGNRTYRQYDMSMVEKSREKLDGSSRLAQFTRVTGLPNYAVEQMICLGEIEREDDPAILALDPVIRLVTSTTRSMIDDIESAYREDSPPDDAVTLERLSRWVGARMKPWGNAMSLLRTRRIPCWHRTDIEQAPCSKSRTLLARTWVSFADAGQMFDPVFDETNFPDFEFFKTSDQFEALEVLNLGSPQANLLSQPDGLAFTKVNKAHLTERHAVVQLARRTISGAELGMMLNQTNSYISRMMARLNAAERACVGWDRRQVFDNWSAIVDAVHDDAVFRHKRRAVAKPLTDARSDVGFARLKRSLEYEEGFNSGYSET